MHLALIKYSVLRLALFVGSLIVLYAVGVRSSLLMVALAAGISLALSYLLLRKQREELTLALMRRTEQRLINRPRLGQSADDEEDAAVAAAEQKQAAAAQQPAGPNPNSEGETHAQ